MFPWIQNTSLRHCLGLRNWYSGRGVDSSWVHSALRPPIQGLLCQPRVIMMVEKLEEWLAGETAVIGENLPQCWYVHHKPHMLPGREPGPPLEEASDCRLSYGTAFGLPKSRCPFHLSWNASCAGRQPLSILSKLCFWFCRHACISSSTSVTFSVSLKSEFLW
jgi:hypothetical protein